MLLEPRVLVSILRLGPRPSRVVESRLQRLELPPLHVRVVIDDQACQSLPLTGSADRGLERIDPKTLFGDDVGDGAEEPVQRLVAATARPGESEVVGIARVSSASCSGQARQAAVETERRQVGDRRRGRGALGQVWVR